MMKLKTNARAITAQTKLINLFKRLLTIAYKTQRFFTVSLHVKERVMNLERANRAMIITFQFKINVSIN